MVVWGTTPKAALGSGEVPKRYHIRNMGAAPTSAEIPPGHWAEKQPGTELWDIVTTGKEIK